MNCEKHGTPFKYEEAREHPGKSIQFCPTCRSEPSEFRKAILAQNPKVQQADPMNALYRGVGVFLLAALALSMSGCGHNPPQEPGAPSPAIEIVKALISAACPGSADPLAMAQMCVPYIGDRQKLLECACGGKTPAPPTPTSRVQPSATATSSPTPVATASPTIPPWQVRLKFYEGFHDCNPYPCNPLDTVTIVSDGKTCAQLGNVPRSSCSGDRTPMCEMPGFDYPGLEKGAGCRTLPYCLTQPNPADVGKCIDGCLAHDSPGTPCGGAAACDPDHMGCPRTLVGCQGKNRGDVNGSHLTWTGLSGCTEQANHYGFTCTGTPGTFYEICTEPWPGATNEDGSPLLGGSKRCKSGWF